MRRLQAVLNRSGIGWEQGRESLQLAGRALEIPSQADQEVKRQVWRGRFPVPDGDARPGSAELEFRGDEGMPTHAPLVRDAENEGWSGEVLVEAQEPLFRSEAEATDRGLRM